jgi:type 1 fimbria pilin
LGWQKTDCSNPFYAAIWTITSQIADWTQNRYVSTAPLPALKGLGLHLTDRTMVELTPNGAPPTRPDQSQDPAVGPIAVRMQITFFVTIFNGSGLSS